MDDMKDKFKGFMKKVNTQLSSSSSGKFKGQGRVLGSDGGGSSSSVPSGPNNPFLARYSQPNNTRPNPNPNPNPSSSSSIGSKPVASSPRKTPDSDQKESTLVKDSTQNPKSSNGFDPFDSLITTGKRSQNGYSINVFECPICGQAYRSEEEVSVHVETCVNNNSENTRSLDDDSFHGNSVDESNRSELQTHVGAYLSGNPTPGSVEVVLRLLSNVVREPDNTKFRKIRMGNPKIKEAITEVAGCVELLEFIGFELREESGELWAVIEEVPSLERISSINNVISLLEPRTAEEEEPRKVEEEVKMVEDKLSVAPLTETGELTERKQIDRKIKVFFSVPESVAARIELPDSFYSLSVDELKREADSRKKKIAESQLLIPKSYKEKQAKNSRRRYTRTLIRIQFPDGVVLQGVFAPWEPTTVLYQFVSEALKDRSLEFELLDPIVVKRRVIPRSAAAGERARTLDDEDLVPSALIKFRPIETDSAVFTGLCNELLEIIEPLN